VRGEQINLDIRGIDAYGLFDAQYRYLSGALRYIPDGLPLDTIARTVGLRRIAEAEWQRLPDQTGALPG
jgi:hypothetical protein